MAKKSRKTIWMGSLASLREIYPEKSEMILKLLSWAGGPSGLAPRLKISRSAIHAWKAKIPAEHVIRIEKISEGKFTRYEQRPDIYPKEKAR